MILFSEKKQTLFLGKAPRKAPPIRAKSADAVGLPFSVYEAGRGKLGAKTHGILALRGLGRPR